MGPRLQLLIILTTVLLILIILDLIRRGRLREEYSLIWLACAGFVLLLAIFPGALDFFAGSLQIEYAPLLILLIGLSLNIITQLYQTVTISRLTGNNRELAQKAAMLEFRLRYQLSQIAPQLITAISRLSALHRFDLDWQNGNENRIQHFIRQALELTVESLNAESGSLVIIDERGDLLQAVLSYAHLNSTYDVRRLETTLKDGLTGWVLKNKQAALVVNTFKDARWLKLCWDENTGERSAMSVPLIEGDHLIGAITVVRCHSRLFTENDLALLMAIAAVIIEPVPESYGFPSGEPGDLIYEGNITTGQDGRTRQPIS